MKKLSTAVWIVAYGLTIVVGLGWGAVLMAIHRPWILGGLLVGLLLTLLVSAVYSDLP